MATPASPASAPRPRRAWLPNYGPIEEFPTSVLTIENREQALLFKTLATLRTDAPLFDDVDELRWGRPAWTFALVAETIGDPRLTTRLETLAKLPS